MPQSLRTVLRAFGFAFVAILVSAASARADGPTRLLGNWLTPDGDGVIAIERCGDALCGRIVGITLAPGEKMPTDIHGTPQCGLTIIRKERPADDGAWLGEVTDPRTGDTYNARLWLDRDGNLQMRGYLGVPLLGETQTWRPYTGKLTSSCDLA